MPATEVLTGLVTGEFYTASVDTLNDPDIEPDVSYATGTGVLVPTENVFEVIRSDGSRYKYQLKNIPFVVAAGTVLTPEGSALRLVANLDQYDLMTPTDWVWTVTNLILDGISYDPFAINVSPLATADLAALAPIPDVPGTLTVIEPGVTLGTLMALLSSYVAMVDHLSARPDVEGPVVWLGGTTGSPPAGMIDGDLWIHS